MIIVGTHLDEIKKKSYTKDWEASMTRLIQDKYMRQDNEYSGLPCVRAIVNVAVGPSAKNVDLLKDTICKNVFQLKHPGKISSSSLSK